MADDNKKTGGLSKSEIDKIIRDFNEAMNPDESLKDFLTRIGSKIKPEVKKARGGMVTKKKSKSKVSGRLAKRGYGKAMKGKK